MHYCGTNGWTSMRMLQANQTPTSSSSGAFFTPNTLLRIEQTLLDLESKTPVSQNAPAMVIKPESDYDNCSNISGSDQESHDSKSFLGDRSGKFHIPDIDPQTYLVANSRRPTGPRRSKTSEMVSYLNIEIFLIQNTPNLIKSKLSYISHWSHRANDFDIPLMSGITNYDLI